MSFVRKTVSLGLTSLFAVSALGGCSSLKNEGDKDNLDFSPRPTQSMTIIGGLERKPNIVLMLADDQSYHLSHVGTPGLSTPNIDKLARDSTFFTNAFSSCASCSPSRSSIFTGMYPHSNGHWRNTITPPINAPEKEFGRESSMQDTVGVHEDIPTLLEILKEEGYVTGITQKWHLSPHWKYPFDYRLQSPRLPVTSGAQSVKTFLNMVRRKNKDDPFFLMVNFGNTHREWQSGIDGRYKVKTDNVVLPVGLPDIPMVRQDYANYLSSVQTMDAAIGHVLEELEESGEMDRTIIIYTSDQGYAYPRAKTSVYFDGTHVPLSIKGPGIKSNVNTDELVSLIDIAPTILDCIGVRIPDNMQGISLRPILEGQKGAKGRKYVFTEHNAHGPGEIYPSRAVFDGRYLYIRNLMPELEYKLPADLYGKDWGNLSYDAIVNAKDEYPFEYDLMMSVFSRPYEELYDIDNDPGQTKNLMNEKEQLKVVEKLRKVIDMWMEETEDPGDPRKISRRV